MTSASTSRKTSTDKPGRRRRPQEPCSRPYPKPALDRRPGPLPPLEVDVRRLVEGGAGDGARGLHAPDPLGDGVGGRDAVVPLEPVRAAVRPALLHLLERPPPLLLRDLADPLRMHLVDVERLPGGREGVREHVARWRQQAGEGRRRLEVQEQAPGAEDEEDGLERERERAEVSDGVCAWSGDGGVRDGEEGDEGALPARCRRGWPGSSGTSA